MFGRRDYDDDAIEIAEADEGLERTPLLWTARVFDILFLPVHFLLFSCHAVWMFVHQWSVTRPLLALLRGIPFVLVFLTALILLQPGGWISPPDLVARYRSAATAALARGESQTADLWLEKAAQLNPNEPRYVLSQALLADEEGRRDEARQMMRRIAPSDGSGPPAAHFWLAQDLIRQSLPLSPELARTLDHHLQQSLRDESLAAESHALLGQLCLIRENRADAIAHFKRAVREKPACHLSLAVLYNEQNQRDKAVDSARKAAAYYAELSATEPENAQHRLRWAQSELLAANYTRAVEILEEALARVDDPQPFHDLLVAACLAWLDEVRQSSPNRLDKQLDILNIAYRYNPNHPDLLALIANLTMQNRDDADSPQVAGLRDALQLALATGTAPPLVHLIVGTRALEAGDTEDAVMHLELAYKLNPDSPSILNNLAWALAHRNPPELDRALPLAEAAIDLVDHPSFHGTRAVILAAVGRSGDAIAELETILRRHPDPAWVHDRLAELYDDTNQTELAQLHTRLAAHIRESAKPSD